MPDIDAVAEAITAAQRAVATDVANVAAAIDTALDHIDQQLATLHERRGELEETLGAVNDQIATVNTHREALVSARAQAPTNDDAPLPATSVFEDDTVGAEDETTDEAGGEGYLEFTEEELDPDVPRTQRILTVLDRAGYEMNGRDIADILNEFGDETTPKVVGGTLANLARRGAVTKVGAGTFTTR